MTSYLNTTQTTLNEMGSYDPLESGGVDKFMEEKLGMEGTMPEAPKYVDMYKDMREEFGVSELEQNMVWYKDMIRKEELLLNQQKNYERGQPVRMGVIEGRVDKATRDRQEQIQWYGNELSRVSDMVQGAYGQIQMIIQFTQMDYETAKDQYQTEFNTRMSVYKAVTEERQQQFENKFAVFKIGQEQFNADRAFASTQWSMMASYISKGQTTWDKMTPDQKAQIGKYEVMMGMPLGFMSNLQMEAGANILSTTQRIAPNGGTYTDIVYQDANGKPQTKSIYTGQSGGSGTAQAEKDLAVNTAGMDNLLYDNMGSDKNVSPATYIELKQQWIGKGYSAYSFDKNFGRYVDDNYAYREENVYQLDATYLKDIEKNY